MRIIIESTTTDPLHPKLYRKVTIESGSDDLDIHGVMELVEDALIGYGYAEKTVEEYFGFEART